MLTVTRWMDRRRAETATALIISFSPKSIFCRRCVGISNEDSLRGLYVRAPPEASGQMRLSFGSHPKQACAAVRRRGHDTRHRQPGQLLGKMHARHADDTVRVRHKAGQLGAGAP